jgi:AraC family transcriptional regulator
MFHPNMTAITEGFAVTSDLKYRSWQGVLADVWEVESHPGAAGEYVSQHPRLFVVLEETSVGSISIDTAPNAIGANGPLSFIPAGLRTWSHAPNSTRLRHLDLHFDVSALDRRLSGELDDQRLSTPRLMFDDERLLTLANLLAADCMMPRTHDLYGDSIALALFIELFQVPRAAERKQGQLSARRLRHAVDFIEAHCLRSIKLQELADLVGLSQSYFSSAFKASTGMAPHQWQMKARIEQVKIRLRQPGASLIHIAHSTGFADQAHMTRVFKQFVGVTPAAWLRAQAHSL